MHPAYVVLCSPRLILPLYLRDLELHNFGSLLSHLLNEILLAIDRVLNELLDNSGDIQISQVTVNWNTSPTFLGLFAFLTNASSWLITSIVCYRSCCLCLNGLVSHQLWHLFTQACQFSINAAALARACPSFSSFVTSAALKYSQAQRKAAEGGSAREEQDSAGEENQEEDCKTANDLLPGERK